MRKTTCLFTVVTMVFLSANLVFADKRKNVVKDEGTESKGMRKMMMHKHAMMMRSPVMVSSNDGGVIVLSGNTLYKYDKNLKLVGEAEIKMGKDCMGMGGMMKGKKCCPMIGGTDDASEGESSEGEPQADPNAPEGQPGDKN